MATPELIDVTGEPLTGALARPPVCPPDMVRLRQWLRDVLFSVAVALDARVRAIRTVLIVFDARLDTHAEGLAAHAGLLADQAAQIAALELRANRALPVAELPAAGPRGALFQLAGDRSLYMGQGAGQPLARFAPAVTP